MKKKPAVVQVETSAPVSKPDIYADRLSKLSPDERVRLRVLLNDSLFVKLMRIVAVMKPSAHCQNCGSGTRDAFSDARANARLSEIRGWEMYEAAIFISLNEPPVVKQQVQENFPDSGRIDADWQRTPGQAADTNAAPKVSH